MVFRPEFWTTVVGSFPDLEAANLCRRLVEGLDVPAWPQLSRRSFRESMYTLFSPSLPGLVENAAGEKITFDTSGNLSTPLEIFYEHYLADDLDYFGLRREYSAGFFAMIEVLQEKPGEWAKGQVTGPVSFGLTVTDQSLRASLYDEQLADVITKNMAMNARWQIRQLRQVRPGVIIFVDEPYMASFGSAFISLSRQQVITMLDEIFAAIHAEGALAGVHCCANTDWSVLLDTRVDILNLDAYGYVENLALYPVELRKFLDFGGVIAWGIVPNNEQIFSVTADDLARELRDGFDLIARKAARRNVEIRADEFNTRSLLTTSCGLGPATVKIAGQAINRLVELGELLH